MSFKQLTNVSAMRSIMLYCNTLTCSRLITTSLDINGINVIDEIDTINSNIQIITTNINNLLENPNNTVIQTHTTQIETLTAQYNDLNQKYDILYRHLKDLIDIP